MTHLVQLMAKPVFYRGYVEGHRQLVARVRLSIGTVSTHMVQQLNQVVAYYYTDLDAQLVDASKTALATCFATALCRLQQVGGMPIFERPTIRNVTDSSDGFELLVPMLFAGCFQQALHWVLTVFNERVMDEKRFVQMTQLINVLKQHAPQGTNSLNFLQAAYAAEIPCTHVALNTFQYGYGCHSRWLDSTFTDQTRHIPAVWAGNKRTISTLLHKTGFPVAPQFHINSETEALSIAQQIGYPVVIKPMDQSLGKGVVANITSPDGLKKAYQYARQYSSNIIVEQHIAGKDYRLLVMGGQLIWAIERIPAGVVGDGVHSIEQLVQQHNQTHKARFPLRYIDLNEQALDYLVQQGFTLHTVLPKNQFVALNRIANISSGGTPVPVLDKVHPDTLQLVQAVAKLLRLDCVGIDLIARDIQESYRDNGAVIIEVNAQPQLGSTTGPHLYGQILKRLISRQGRMPIVVLLGVTDALIAALNTSAEDLPGIAIATSTASQLLGEAPVHASSVFNAGLRLLVMQEVRAMLYCISDEQALTDGLPFDRFNALAVCANSSALSDNPTLTKACMHPTPYALSALPVVEQARYLVTLLSTPLAVESGRYVSDVIV